MQLRESLLQLADLRGTLNGVVAAVNIIHTNVLNLEADVNDIQTNVQMNRNMDVDVEQNAPIQTGNPISVLESGTVIAGFNCMHILVELMFHTF